MTGLSLSIFFSRSLDFSQIQTLNANEVRPIMAEDFVPALRQVIAALRD